MRRGNGLNICNAYTATPFSARQELDLGGLQNENIMASCKGTSYGVAEFGTPQKSSAGRRTLARGSEPSNAKGISGTITAPSKKEVSNPPKELDGPPTTFKG